MKKSVFPGKPGEMQLAPLDLIDDNPYQPKNRPYGNLHTLAADIRQQCEALPETMGLIHVPRGRIVDSRIQLLEGHRRTRAFRLLKEQYGDNWRKMPVALGEFTDRQMSEISWSENNNREELDPISRAESLQQAIDEFGITLKEAGKRYPSKKGSMSKGAVSNLIRLLQLPEAVRELICKGKIGQRHGRELVRLVQLPDEVQCRWKAQAAVDHNWTVSQLKEQVDIVIQNAEYEKQQAAEREARAKHRETRYCLFCGHGQEVNGSEIHHNDSISCQCCHHRLPVAAWSNEPAAEPVAENDFGIRWCPACGERRKFSIDRIATESSLTCLQCGQSSATSDWLRQPPTESCEAEETLGPSGSESGGAEARPEPGSEYSTTAQEGKFDCPRCKCERIVKLNGNAWCLSCDAKWATAGEFHVEASAMLEATAAETGQDTVSNFVSLLAKLNQQEVNLIGKLVNAPQRAPQGNYGYNDVAVAAAEALQKNEDNELMEFDK